MSLRSREEAGVGVIHSHLKRALVAKEFGMGGGEE
jgi:hypothetical protein